MESILPTTAEGIGGALGGLVTARAATRIADGGLMVCGLAMALEAWPTA